MINIKIQDEAATITHYGVSAKDGAPGRGSGRYPLGSGDRPRSIHNPGIDNDGHSIKSNSKIGKTESRKNDKGSLLSDAINAIAPNAMSNKSIKPSATLSYSDAEWLIDSYPEFFPEGPVGKDNRVHKAYKTQRDKYCAKDEKTGLYLDKPAEGVSQEEFDKYTKWRLKNKVPRDNVGYDIDTNRRLNCIATVIANDLNSRGYDVTAKAFSNPQVDSTFHYAYKNLGNSNYYKGIYGAVNDMIKQGSNASGVFMCSWKHGGGHAMAYRVTTDPVNKRKTVVITNPQDGDYLGYFYMNGNSVSSYGKLNALSKQFDTRSESGLGVLRLDNAAPNPKTISKYVE